MQSEDEAAGGFEAVRKDEGSQILWVIVMGNLGTRILMDDFVGAGFGRRNAR